jgi:hypothetical protein
MGGPHCKRKTIMQGSGRYHEKRWNVVNFNILTTPEATPRG